MRIPSVVLLLLLIPLCIAMAMAQHPKPPTYCNPCVFYSGDFDVLNPKANAIWNGNNGTTQGDIWVPFSVENRITATGFFVNELFTTSQLGTNPTPYAVQKGIMKGQAGTVVCSGSDRATATPTGRQGYGLVELTYQIKKLPKSCQLTKGTYWLNIEPQYAPSTEEIGYLGDVEDVSPRHHYGSKNVTDDSYFNAPQFDDNYVPTAGPEGACGGIGCDMFSIGITGSGK